MNKALMGLLGLGLVVGSGAFGADPRNQAAFKHMIGNAASEKPVMQGVVFKVPFLKDPAPKKAYPGLYPEHFTWGTDAVLKYYDLGEGYWQTNGINLNDGQEVKVDDDEWKAHIRFKYNPPSDPMHPGHAIVGINSAQHKVSFAPLGQVDFDSVLKIPANKWLKTSENEQAAVWNLKPGDVVGVKIEAQSIDQEEDASGSRPPAAHRTFVAKVQLDKLSHDQVRFDYVYRNDGKQEFMAPSYPENQGGH